MLKSLSIRNAKRQAKEYLVYFITLVLTTSLMYALNALIFSKDILSAIQIDTSMRFMIIVTSVIVVLILAWLTGYMMNFMLRKRSKELSIYMVLGVENKDVIRLFRRENLIIGVVALLVGYLGGLFTFQLLKAIVTNLIGLEYKLSIGFSMQAIVLTALYFSVIYLVSVLKSNNTLKKFRLCDLLNYDRCNEETTIKSNWRKILVFCVSILCLAIAIFLFSGTPLKDGMSFPIGILFVALFIYCFFMSLPSFVVTILEAGDWKYKGNRVILLRNFTSKIDSISKTIGFLSVVFSLALFLISIGLIQIATFNHRVNLVPFDISIVSEKGAGNFLKYQEYINKNTNVEKEFIYNIYQSNSTEYTDLNFSLHGFNYIPGDVGTRDLCITYSDYLHLREMLGYAPVKMGDNDFIVHCLPYFYSDIQSHSANNPMLAIDGYDLNLAGIYTENLDQYDGLSNGRYFILVVPDIVARDMEFLFAKYSVMTNGTLQYSLYESLLAEFGELKPVRFDLHDNYQPSAEQAGYLDARVAIQKSNGILYSTGTLPFWYIAFILCIAGVTILVSNILSDEAKYKRQFTLLKNLGYSRRTLDGIILLQLVNFFAVPAIPAIVLNCVLSPIYAKSFGANVFVPRFDLWYSIILAYVVYLVVYLIYYIATYILLRKNTLANNKFYDFRKD